MAEGLDEIYKIISRLTEIKSSSNVSLETAMIKGLLDIEKKLKQVKREEKRNAKRVNDILNSVMALANLKYDKKARVSSKKTGFDALAVGINMLGEELQTSTVSLHEKEILLKEIHHRVKNNLQVISSLLNLQSEKITNPVLLEAFTESRSRIKAMALVHEKLFESKDLSRIDFTKYMHSFLIYMDKSYNLNPNKVQLHIDIRQESHYFKIDTAIACGLILNELISNSCKYAFPDKQVGNIYLYFGQENKTKKSNNYILQVADDGVGIAPQMDITNSNSLGLQLINMLTKQIDGTLELDRTKGTKFTIHFSAENN